MALYLLNEDRLLIPFRHDRTAILSYPPFPGGRVWRFQDENMNLLIKEVISELFSIRYKSFQFSVPQKIESISDEVGFHSRVMLQNNLHLSVNPLETLHQREGTVSLLSGKAANCIATMEANVEYRALDIYAGPDLAIQLNHFFPDIEFDLDKIKNLFPFPCFISPPLHKVIDEILDCPYDERTSHFYFDVKVREYFYLLLQECIAPHKSKYRFTPYEVEQLHIARDILLSDLTKPPLTIRQLARNRIHSERSKKDTIRMSNTE